jgi:hypothetical protein
MEIEDPGGRRMAMVQKAMIDPVRERWTVHVDGSSGPLALQAGTDEQPMPGGRHVNVAWSTNC